MSGKSGEEPCPTRGPLCISDCGLCGQCAVVDQIGTSAVASPARQPRLRLDSDAPASLPQSPGVFRLLGDGGEALYIAGVADLRQGVTRALQEPVVSSAVYFDFEEDSLYTQRESELLTIYAQECGHLPPGNDLGDELFGDELSGYLS